jgi:hypothetical protein
VSGWVGRGDEGFKGGEEVEAVVNGEGATDGPREEGGRV